MLALKVIELPAECTPKHDFVSSEGLLGLPSAPSPAPKTILIVSSEGLLGLPSAPSPALETANFVSSEGLLGLPSAPSPALKTVRHLKP